MGLFLAMRLKIMHFSLTCHPIHPSLINMKATRIIALIGLTFFLFGCAAKPGDVDPYEGYNRKMFAFNGAVDQLYVRPIATLYSKSPDLIQAGVNNFIDNFQSLNSTANFILQIKLKRALHNLVRFALNTTIGVGGLFDPATKLGLGPDKTDFGLTLAEWGYHQSNYFILPLFGPSTVRDGLGFVVDQSVLSPAQQLIQDRDLRHEYLALRMINARALLIPAVNAREKALDPYVFERNAYMQRRKRSVERTLGEPIKTQQQKAKKKTHHDK